MLNVIKVIPSFLLSHLSAYDVSIDERKKMSFEAHFVFFTGRCDVFEYYLRKGQSDRTEKREILD